MELEVSRSSEEDYLSWGYALKDDWELNEKNTTLSSGGATATLTNGTSNIAAAVWKNTPLDLTNGFAIGFVYQASGNRAAELIASRIR